MAVQKKKKSSFNPDPEVEAPEDQKAEGAEGEAPETETPETESSKEEEGEEGDKDKEDDKDKDKDVVPDNIPVRKSTQQQIIGRQKRTIKKLRDKKDEGDGKSADSEEGDNELSPEASDAVEKAIDKKVKPVIDALASTVDAQELKDLCAEDSNVKKYKKRIEAYMANKHWKGVPVLAIYRYLAWEDKKAVNKELEDIANKEAEHTKSPGRTLKKKKTSKASTGAPTIEEVEAMSDKDIERLGQRAEQGEFIQE